MGFMDNLIYRDFGFRWGSCGIDVDFVCNLARSVEGRIHVPQFFHNAPFFRKIAFVGSIPLGFSVLFCSFAHGKKVEGISRNIPLVINPEVGTNLRYRQELNLYRSVPSRECFPITLRYMRRLPSKIVYDCIIRFVR